MNSLCVDGRNVIGRELKSIKIIPTHTCEHAQECMCCAEHNAQCVQS